MGRSSRRKKRQLVKILAISGAIASVAIVLVLFLVIGSITANNEECEQIYLQGTFSFGGTPPCKAKPDKKYSQISIVVGNTANMPIPKLSNELKEYIAGSIVSRSEKDVADIQILSVTPEKSVIAYDGYVPKEYKNVKDFNREITDAIEDIESSLRYSPRANGADFIGSMERAAEEMSKCSSDEKCLIIVIGSGLSDSGKLNFPEMGILNGDKNTTEEDIDVVLDALNEAGKLDKIFQNIDIVWQDLGTTVAPQPYLDQSNKNKVQKIYEKILNREGATKVEFIRNKSKCDKNEDGTGVVADCEEKSVETKGFTVRTTPVANSENIYVKMLDEKSLQFEGNKSIFANQETARTTLDQLAAEMRTLVNNKAAHFTVTGYIARTSQTDCESDKPIDSNLDFERADKVRAELVARGIPGDHIAAKGGGFGKYAEQCPNGQFNYDEASMAANRIVIVEG